MNTNKVSSQVEVRLQSSLSRVIEDCSYCWYVGTRFRAHYALDPELFKNRIASYFARFSSVNWLLSSVKSNSTLIEDALAFKASMDDSILSCL